MKLAIDFGALQSGATPKLGGATIGSLIGQVMELVIPLAGMLMLIYLVWSGVQYMISLGDPKTLATAKQHITYAIIGFAVIAFSYVAASAVGVSLELNPIQTLFP